MEDTQERRNPNSSQRKSRVTLGGASAPIAILVSYTITDLYGKQMSDQTLIAMSTLIGSAVSVATICFWDLRGLVLARLARRRQTDRKRR